jgi:putative oxidoreductase
VTRWLLRRLSRLFLSGIFVVAGSEAFQNPGPRVAKAAGLGLPNPELATKANAAVMVGAGTAMALGLRNRWAAAALLASLVPTTLAGHPYWKEEDAQARSTQRTQFLKNLGLLGGLLAVLADG